MGEGRIIETKKGVVRLPSVRERSEQLFGKAGTDIVADRLEHAPTGPLQLELFPNRAEETAPKVKGSGLSSQAGSLRHNEKRLNCGWPGSGS